MPPRFNSTPFAGRGWPTLFTFIPAMMGWVTLSYIAQTGALSGRISLSTAQHSWFARFLEGCHKRIGNVICPDKAIHTVLIKAYLELLCKDLRKAIGKEDLVAQKEILLFRCLLVAGFFGSLRGEELNRVDLAMLGEHWEAVNLATPKFVPIYLCGKLKNKNLLQAFFHPLAQVTKGGIEIKFWFEEVLALSGSNPCGSLFKGKK